MDVPKSKFPTGIVPPESALLIVSEYGYVATQQGGTNAPPVFGVAFVGGKCYLIGPFPPMVSYAANMDNPKLPIISLKEGDKETRKAEVQLAGETMTVKTTIIASPSGGPGGRGAGCLHKSCNARSPLKEVGWTAFSRRRSFMTTAHSNGLGGMKKQSTAAVQALAALGVTIGPTANEDAREEGRPAAGRAVANHPPTTYPTGRALRTPQP